MTPLPSFWTALEFWSVLDPQQARDEILDQARARGWPGICVSRGLAVNPSERGWSVAVNRATTADLVGLAGQLAAVRVPEAIAAEGDADAAEDDLDADER